MKDSNQSFEMSNLTATTILFSVVALLAILGSVFISQTVASASESAKMTRIAADIDESYFTENNDRLAQGGKLERRSGQNDEAVTEDEESMPEAGQCENVYIEDHLRIDFDNDKEQVLKLQSFLKTYEGYDAVNLTGTFDEATLQAVKAFQTRYDEDILTPWGYQADEATGYVYITTKQKINEIYCDEKFLLNREQQAEIRAYREKLNSWRAQGASFEIPQYLANYYGYSWSEAVANPVVLGEATAMDVDEEPVVDNGITVTETPDDDMATTATSTEGGRGWFARLFGIGDDPSEDEEATTTATTSTATDEIEDDADDENEDERGFFARLFGVDDDEEATSTATTSTTTQPEDLDEEDVDEETATTASSSGIDNVAAGVYNGVNGIVNFLLSPTFLLVVLVVLILLLIATLIESDGEEEEGSDASNEAGEGDADTDSEDVEEAEPVDEHGDTTHNAWEEYAEVEEVETESDDETTNENEEDKQ